MMHPNKSLIINFSVAAAILGWIAMFTGMGVAGSVTIDLPKDHKIINFFIIPFEFISTVGFFGGNFVALILVLIGAPALPKSHGKKLCLMGEWGLIIYLTALLVQCALLTISEFSLLISWFVFGPLPFLAVSLTLSLLALKEIQKRGDNK